MVLLPIAERELRVAARKPSTFWVRLVGVLVTLVIAIGFLILASIGGFPVQMSTLGRTFFSVLTWFAFAACLSAGLFFTSDCLSEEKREGTIGFLFLTDLKGHDVVLGKLLATSLRGVCVMLGVFPVLSVTLVMGGVTGTQYWRTCLALVSALFLSLVAGLFVSSISRLSQRAMATTLLLLLLLLAGGPAVDGLLAFLGSGTHAPRFGLSSPVILFLTASQWGTGSGFWPSVLVNQLLIGMLLGMTFWILPRAWQERSKAGAMAERSWQRRLRLGTAHQRTRGRRLLEDNPVLWLTCRERWQAKLLWGFALIALVGMSIVGVFSSEAMVWSVWSNVAGLMILVLYLGIASQAGRFLVEARQNGFMELLLITPVTAQQVVTGQWRAMLRTFGVPLAILLGCHLVGNVGVQYLTWTSLATTAASMPAPAPAATNATATATNVVGGAAGSATAVTPTVSSPEGFQLGLIVVAGALGTVVVAANLVALIWFGMWMGLTSKNVNLATLKTLLFVQVIPWFVISFAGGLITMLVLLPTIINAGPSATPFASMMWYPLIASGVTLTLGLIKNVGFVMYARKRLHTQFRERAGQSFDRPASPLPPIVRPSEPAAPVA